MQVIKASAGSGKTYTLARLYIEQLLWARNPETGETKLRKAPGYHEHILAITFTNKATDEMKSRIVEELHNLSIGECDYMEQFLTEHPGDSEQDIKTAARWALKNMLFNYTHFNVSTIDSFFQVILRTFARELDRDYNYEIQLDEEYATGIAVHNFLMTLGDSKSANGQMGKWVQDFIDTQIKNNGDWDFFGKNAVKGLLKFAGIINKEDFRERRNAIVDYLSDLGAGKGLSRIERFKKAVLAAGKRYEQVCKDTTKVLNDFFATSHLDQGEIKLKAASFLLLMNDPDSLTSNNLKTLRSYSTDDEALSKKIMKKNSVPQEIIDAANDEFMGILQNYFMAFDKAGVLAKLQKNIGRLGLLGKIDEQLTNYRKDNNSILLADTNELIATVLDSGVDFIYERVGVWINNFMIDEFQDTSRKQYFNFKPLLAESLDENHSNLIIGDEKQSIYRFRNSDPDLLRAQLLRDFTRHYDEPLKLDTNYRSFKNIVTFNNAFFKALVASYAPDALNPQFPKLNATYSNLEQKYHKGFDKTGKQGYVRVNFIYTSDSKTSNTPRHTDADGNVMSKKADCVSTLPAYILDIKHNCGYDFKDILILVDTHDDGNLVVRQLLAHNDKAMSENRPEDHIGIVSNESLLLKNSPCVRLIVSVLRFIDATQYCASDEDAVQEVDNSEITTWQRLMKKRLNEQFRYKMLHEFGRMVGVSDADADHGELLAECFKLNAELRKMPVEEQINSYNEELKRLLPDRAKEMSNLVGLVDKIIQEYLVSSGMTQGSETAFLLAFQDVIIEFSGKRNCGGTVHEFIKYWDTRKDKLAIPSGSDENAVKVMTIHASKGLEAPCVIVPFADWKMVKPDNDLWLKREQWATQNDAGQPVEGIWSDGEDCIVPPLIPIDDTFLSIMPQFKSYYNEITQESLIDKVNKTYVAFTRPRQALHIFAYIKKLNNDNNDIGNILLNLLPTLNDKEGNSIVTVHEWRENHPNDNYEGIDYCEIGRPEACHHKAVDTTSEQEVISMPDYVVNSALPRLQVRLPQVMTDKQDEGQRLHRVLSMIKHPGDERRALAYAVKRHIIFDDDEHYWNLKRVKVLVEHMYADERTKQWFAPDNKVFNERPIVTAGMSAKGTDTERPDRVVVRPDGTTIVVDYKFGTGTSSKLKKRYHDQVREYMNLLCQAGHTAVKGYLWFVRTDEIEEVEASQELTLW